MADVVYTTVSVAGAPPVDFCVEPAADDPVGRWFLDNDWIDEPVHRAFLRFVEPGRRIVDLGSHLGTFSLSAAALGAQVIAVDANRRHVELLELAAARNGFRQLHPVHAAVSPARRPVSFIDRNIHGRLARTGEGGTSVVQSATVSELLERFGWDSVDLVKLDIEGAELSALEGMAGVFAAGQRPEVVFECNGSMLPFFGGSVEVLRARFERLGYELFLVDNLRPGILVEAPSDALQPECVSDYIATVNGREQLEGLGWRVEGRFSRPALVSRLLDQAASTGAGYRRYAAETIAAAPRWLRDDQAVVVAARTLALDHDPEVRAAEPGRRSRAVEPPETAIPDELVVYADRISLRRSRRELDYHGNRSPHDPHPVLEPASFHVRAGQLVGLCGDRAETTTALLQALAGHDRPLTGVLATPVPAVLLGDLGGVLELELGVRENLEILSAYLGGHIRDASWIDEAAARVGIGHRLDDELADLDGGTVVQLVLSAALECTAAPLLLIDRLPVAGTGLHDWAIARAWQLRLAGTAIVQAFDTPGDLLGPADRLMWFQGTRLVASGNPDAVVDLVRRRSLQLAPGGEPRYWAVTG